MIILIIITKMIIMIMFWDGKMMRMKKLKIFLHNTLIMLLIILRSASKELMVETTVNVVLKFALVKYYQ